jgi:hypothetical protein
MALLNRFTFVHCSRHVVFLLLLSACFFSSCNNSSSTVSDETLELTTKNATEFQVDDFFELKKIIPLETTADALIRNIAKVYLDQDHLIFFDNMSHEIFHYDTNGKLINKIANIGEGPGEYRSISDMIYDYQNKVIYILDGGWTRKVLTYTLDGQFVNEKKLNFNPAAFIKVNDDTYAFYSGNGSNENTLNPDNTFDNLIYTDSTFSITSSSHPISMVWDGYVFTSGGMNTFFYQNNEDSIFFIPQLPTNMQVYAINTSSTEAHVYRQYKFSENATFADRLSELGRDEVTDVFDILMKNSYTYNMYSYMKNDCFTYFAFSQSGPHPRMVINNADPGEYYINKGMQNPKHGRFHPYPVWTASHAPLAVNFLQPNDIFKEEFEVGMEIRDQIEADDNPVLVLYEMRPC